MAGKIIALVPAAGVGSRFGETLPKQYLPLNGQPLIVHTLRTLASVTQLSEIVVVLSPEDQLWTTQMAAWPQWASRIRPIWVGGNSRGASVANGLAALADSVTAQDWVLVHDAARPCLQVSWVQRLIDEVTNDAVGGLLALPLADTVKLADGEGRVSKTVPRDHLWRAQTPQMFRYGMLCEALKRFPTATDEAEAIEALGYQPKLVMGHNANLKVTYPPDMELASILLPHTTNERE